MHMFKHQFVSFATLAGHLNIYRKMCKSQRRLFSSSVSLFHAIVSFASTPVENSVEDMMISLFTRRVGSLFMRETGIVAKTTLPG